MKVAILGFGREGKSVLSFLKTRGLTRMTTRINADKKTEIWILDKNPNLKILGGLHSRLGKNYLENLESFDLIFRSPGIPYNLPELKKARQAGVKFSSATKLFFEEIGKMARRGSPQVIGITGTKGKGTASTLLYETLKAAGKNALLAGNIGKSALDILPKIRKGSIVILELSSFQLQDLKLSPQTAVVLDVFPDHQDSHLNLREYYNAKANIALHQKRGDKVFFFSSKSGGDSWFSHRVAVRGRDKKIAVDEGRFKLFTPSDLKIPGYHNFKNAVMAATVALDLGIDRKTVLKAVKNFRGLEHRLEFVRKLTVRQAHYKNKLAVIHFYNDSASTNPQTSAAAVLSFKNPTILIAGGYDKGLDYKPLARAIKKSSVKSVVLFGANKEKIKRQIADSKAQIVLATNLRRAVKTAYRFAKKLLHSEFYTLNSVVVLFSPGAASFDMFKNYADRGEQFKKIVERLPLTK